MTSKGKREPFWLGGASACLAVTITHPIDQTKIRSQTLRTQQSIFQIAKGTIAAGGVRNLWTGVSASLLRQCTYGTIRFGVYNWLKNGEKGPIPIWKLMTNGAIAGLAAGIAGSPAELVLVRMCADGIKPPHDRFNYSNPIQALRVIAQQEGLSRMFRGGSATALRSVVLNATQLPGYDMTKKALLKTPYFHDNALTHLTSAVCAGTVAVTICAPIDVMKSRMQSTAARETPIVTLVRNSIRQEGMKVLFKGWVPAVLRMTPNTVLTFMFYEQIKKTLMTPGI